MGSVALSGRERQHGAVLRATRCSRFHRYEEQIWPINATSTPLWSKIAEELMQPGKPPKRRPIQPSKPLALQPTPPAWRELQASMPQKPELTFLKAPPTRWSKYGVRGWTSLRILLSVRRTSSRALLDYPTRRLRRRQNSRPETSRPLCSPAGLMRMHSKAFLVR